MTVKLLTEPHLRFLSLKGGCTCLSESTLVKMPHCRNSRVTAHLSLSLQANFCSLLMTFANNLVPDQDRQNACPDLGPKLLTL